MKRGRIVLIATLLWGCASESEVGPGAPGTYGDTEGVRWTNGNPDFAPAKAPLIIPLNKTVSGSMKDFGQDDNCFYASATGLKRFYEGLGAKPTLLPVNTPEKLIAALDGLAQQKTLYDRIIFLAHGAWDGPMFYQSKQIGCDWPAVTQDCPAASSTYTPQCIQMTEKQGQIHSQWHRQKSFLAYGLALSKVLASKGWIWVGSCNSATEGRSLFGATRYTDAMACATSRMTYGVATKTACWDVEDRVKKLEQGIKTPMIWRSNPANLPAQMLCLGESMPPFPPEYQCTKIEHCPAMNICDDYKCLAVECITDDHCSDKNICSSNKCQLVECVNNGHCPEKNICQTWSNKCEAVECVTNDHCPDKNICQTWSHKCEPVECVTNDHCTKGQVCNANRCESPSDSGPSLDVKSPAPDAGAPPSLDAGVPTP
jgi:Cys-rich repeat protein